MTAISGPVAVVGVGEMGLPIARNLSQAGWRVAAVDRDEHRLSAASFAEAMCLGDAIAKCSVIFTSLPSSESFVALAEEELLPTMARGQWLIDLGTVTPPETRRLATALGERGVHVLDAPVSGGPWGVENGCLRMFVGGEGEDVTAAMPLLEAIAGPRGSITHCGPAGRGQIVKGVNQLMMALGAAAYLEAAAFGVRAGVPADVLADAVGGDGRWRADFAAVARQIADGNGIKVGTKFRELPYFLAEAEASGCALPLTSSLWDCLADAPRVTTDDHRQAPSFWHELLAGGEPR